MLATVTSVYVFLAGCLIVPIAIRDIAAPGTELPLPGDAAFMKCSGASALDRTPTMRLMVQVTGLMNATLTLAAMASTFQKERSTMQIVGLGFVSLAYIMVVNQEAWFACDKEADFTPYIALLAVEGLLMVMSSIVGPGAKEKSS